MMGKQVIIIGAGYGGLSLGAKMAQAGHKVRILEKNPEIGGRARLWEEKGYKFDMGPSWYLMPEVFENFFHGLDRKLKDYLDVDRLANYYKVFFEGQAPVTITGDLEKTKALFDTFEQDGGKKLEKYMEKAQYKYDTAMGQFLYKEYTSLFDFFNWKIMTEGLKLDIFSSLDSFVGKFFKDIRAKQILEYAMVFLGASPQNAPALYSIMSHVDLKLGVWFPKGGMNAVAQALAKVCTELGAEIQTGADVQKVLVEGGRAVGVRTASGDLQADLVINTGDYHWGETRLLEEKFRSYPEKFWKKSTVAPSMFIVYLGIGKKIPGLEHHNLYFSRDWDRHFDQIFKTPGWPENPCFYLSAISRTDPEMAPAGCENLFLLIPAAPGLEDTDQVRQEYLAKALDHVERVTGEKIRDAIQVQRVYSMRDFEKDYHAFQGTALGLAHTLFQTAVFRPAHRSKKVKGLYYNGQYTHPGVGVPMCLISSEILIKEIEKDLKKG